MPDRSIMPAFQEVTNLKVPRPQIWHLSNGIPVYETNLGTQEIIKLELIFLAGRPYERKKLASRSTPAMLKEGTENYSSGEIAETVDFYGGTLSMPINLDTSNILLYSLNKYFGRLLPLLADILSKPAFPQKELDSFIIRNQQRLQVELTKNEVVAYRKFTELLYGDEHPYGYNSFPETYTLLTRADLVDHFQENFTAGNCRIFLSGKIDKTIRTLLDTHLSPAILPGNKREVVLPEPDTEPVKIRVPFQNSVQTAIRIGSRLFNRSHRDYNGMYVLNTILGGYFGSRLMNNIREDKGYTYNVYSNHDSMMQGGYFYVASEVGNEFLTDTLQQMYLEMEKLQQDLVEEDELAMVRNYLLGNLLTNLDGPFNISEVIKTFEIEGMPASAFEEMVEVIQHISPETLRDLAQKYFSKENMWEVIV